MIDYSFILLDRFCNFATNHLDMNNIMMLGVSTEGTTMEILDRIQRKEMEKYNY